MSTQNNSPDSLTSHTGSLVVNDVDIGGLGTGTVPSEVHTNRFSFRNFESLTDEIGVFVKSEELRFSCHGHMWELLLYPRGIDEKTNDAGYISIFLRMIDKESKKVKASYKIRVPHNKRRSHGVEIFDSSTGLGWGRSKFVKQKDIRDPSKGLLVDGTLKVEVDIQVFTKADLPWTPMRDTSQKTLLHMFTSKQYSDVTFTVGGVNFLAHRSVIACCAPTLAEAFEDGPQGQDIHIDGTDPTIFEKFLLFIYGNTVPDDILKEDARSLLAVADRFGCTQLKLVAESHLVSSITIDTAAELILLAEATYCALLKEAAIDFFNSNASAVIKTSGWTQLRQSPEILAELLEGKYAKKRKHSEESDLNQMRVSALRRRLDEKGMDVDGSREMLVNRLRDGTD